jgi:adenine/guanine/hypoxanthine permease
MSAPDVVAAAQNVAISLPTADFGRLGQGQFFSAAIYCFIGALLGFVGLIHAESVGWNVGGQIALGYAFAGIVLLAFGLVERGRAAPAPDQEPAVPAQREEQKAVAAPIDTTRPATA